MNRSLFYMHHRSLLAAVMTVSIGMGVVLAAPKADSPRVKEVPRVVMKNLRIEGQTASKERIELARKKFLAVDADLEAGTWGFTRTLSYQVSYVFKEGDPPNTFPEQIITHPVVPTDPALVFWVSIYRGDKITDENLVATVPALFGNDVKPWEAKVRYWLTTPDQAGEYTLVFSVRDQEQPKENVKLAEQKIVIR